jgi:hypothetical protein
VSNHYIVLDEQRLVVGRHDAGALETIPTYPRPAMRTIFVRVTNEASRSYAPVLATRITSTTFSIDSVHSNFGDPTLEFGAGNSGRCKTVRLHGSGEATARQRMAAVEGPPPRRQQYASERPERTAGRAEAGRRAGAHGVTR